jgi:hypothetical protein
MKIKEKQNNLMLMSVRKGDPSNPQALVSHLSMID